MLLTGTLPGAFWIATGVAATLATVTAHLWYRLENREARLRRADAEVERLDRALAERGAANDALERALEIATADTRLEKARADAFAAAIDALPWPIWLRDGDLRVAWANAAQRAVASGGARAGKPPAPDAPERELTTGGGLRMLAELARSDRVPQSQRLLILVEGERRFYRVTETPLPDDGVPDTGTNPPARPVMGFAENITPLETLKGDLDRHLSANAEVLERVGSAIAIFDPDSKLVFFNRAYGEIWGLEEDWLRTRPTHGEVLEELHARRRLPEHADFPTFKRDRLERHRRLTEPMEELLHLPDGTTLRSLSAPHPLGGVVLVMDDVTNHLALMASFNTLVAVQREVLSQLAEGVAIFGGDGRLKLSNSAFAQMWEVDEETLENEPHVTEVFERLRPLLERDEDWAGLKEDLVGATLDRAIRSGHLERTDGRVVEFAIEPLPDGAVLNLHMDVTDNVTLEDSLRTAEAALAAAERLRETFLATASVHLRAPLTAIMGHADALSDTHPMERDADREEHVQGMRIAAKRALRTLDDMLDLSTVGDGEDALDTSEVEIAPLLRSLAVRTRDWARRDGIDLTTEIPDDRPGAAGDPAEAGGLGVVVCDEPRLWRALFGLLVAMLHSPSRAMAIHIRAYRNDDEIVIHMGPPDMTTESAAERTAGRTTRENRGGMALSVASARSVFERHGGGLESLDDPDRGAAVICRLPTHPRQAARPARVG